MPEKTFPDLEHFESPMPGKLAHGDLKRKTLLGITALHPESSQYDRLVPRQFALQGHVDQRTFHDAKRAAGAEGRSVSSLVGHAVRIYLSGGAETYARTQAEQGAATPKLEPDEEALLRAYREVRDLDVSRAELVLLLTTRLRYRPELVTPVKWAIDLVDASAGKGSRAEPDGRSRRRAAGD